MAGDVGAYFDDHAQSFDTIYLGESRWSRLVNRLLRRAVYERFALALSHSGDVRGRALLDIGCGSGRYMLEYARRGAARVVGVDFAASMLALGRDLVTSEGFGDVCSFVEGDFMALPFEEPFDVVIAMGVFDYVEDAPAFLKKMAKVSQGVVIASFPGRSPIRSRLRAVRYRLRRCPLFFYTHHEMDQLVASAGFVDYELIYMKHSGTGWVLVGRTTAVGAGDGDG